MISSHLPKQAYILDPTYEHDLECKVTNEGPVGPSVDLNYAYPFLTLVDKQAIHLTGQCLAYVLVIVDQR